MQDLLAFMNDLNIYFVLLVAVLATLIVALGGMWIAKRAQQFDHQEKLEQKRIDASRAITPIKPRSEERY